MKDTRILLFGLLIAIIVGVHGVPHAFAADPTFLIVGERGQLYTVSTSEGKNQIEAVDVPVLRDHVCDTHYESTDRKLYLTTNGGRLYELDLSKTLKGYQRIPTEEEFTFSIFYNRKEKQPVWLHLGDDKSASRILFRGKDNRIQAGRSDDIEFTEGHVFGMHIDGWKTSRSFRAMDSQLSSLLKDYPDSRWLIEGRSGAVAVYAREIADLTAPGEPYRYTYLFHNRMRDLWRIQSLGESARSWVFGDVAVIQGIYDIKGDKDPNTGNLIQGRPSGNWYFYVAGDNAVISVKLDPSVTVQYATAKEAIISGAGKLMKLNLEDKGQSEPNVLVELPSELTVFGVYPFSKKE
jgi:hypothetical protein